VPRDNHWEVWDEFDLHSEEMNFLDSEKALFDSQNRPVVVSRAQSLCDERLDHFAQVSGL
jgi:hypothetical protein